MAVHSIIGIIYGIIALLNRHCCRNYLFMETSFLISLHWHIVLDNYIPCIITVMSLPSPPLDLDNKNIRNICCLGWQNIVPKPLF